METILDTKNTIKYVCEICDFKCSKQSYWKRHIITAKHLKLTNVNTLVTPDLHKCKICNKQYKSRVGLWKHIKKCQAQQAQAQAQQQTQAQQKTQAQQAQAQQQALEEKKPLSAEHLTHMVIELVKSNTELQKQNHEFQEKMLEMYKNSSGTGNSIGNVNNINSHNKTFNLQFFLNEQCKDAMNITDFIDSFQLQFADLERVGEIGYVDGISELIIKKLNEMDIYKRPIHCSDTKRDIMFVRAENVWEKETNGHSRLRLFIKQITHKNMKLIPLWAETHPQAKDHQHPLNDNYLGMVSQAMGGRGNLEESENKIIKRIAKTVYIDKYVV